MKVATELRTALIYKFVLAVTADNDCLDLPDYAELMLTQGMAARLLAWVDRFQTCRAEEFQLYEMVYWDSPLSWLGPPEEKPDRQSYDDTVEILDELQARLQDRLTPFIFTDFDDGEVCPLPSPYLPFSGEVRTECGQVLVTAEDVRWIAVLKHTDIYLRTEAVPVSLIRQVANGEPIPCLPWSIPGDSVP